MAYAPDHEALTSLALTQAGYFTTAQANDCGFSNQLIQSHLKTGNFERVHRGIYHLTMLPPGEQSDLVVDWLWSRQAGVFSHQTVLSLLHLSDILPARSHMTLPTALEARLTRERPKGLVLHFADLGAGERQWFGAVPITTPYRAILDCLEASVGEDTIAQAIDQADERGLLTRRQVEYTRALLVVRGHRDA